MVNDWNNLDTTYKFVRMDSTIGKHPINCRLEKNGNVVAYGRVKKDGIPHGDWFILSNLNHPKYGNWGTFRNGRKVRK